MSTALGRLQDKVAVVTGSTSGIGEGIAHTFAHEGAYVVLSGRNEEAAKRIITEIASRGISEDRLFFQPTNLSNPDECRRLIEFAVERFNGLDILVNNAGNYTRGTVDNTTLELWDMQMAVNLRAPFVLTQAAVPHLRERGGGSIVNIGSVNAYIGGSDLLSYSTSKGGLMTFTKNAARQLARDHIRVNILNVGWTLTQGEDHLRRVVEGDEDWLDRATESRPFGRMLLPRDIALAALFFASDDSAMITGSVLNVEQYPIS